MTYEIWIVSAIIFVSFISFSFEILRSDLVAILCMALLIFSGVITPTEAIAGFSNPATVTVACMFIISACFVKSGLVDVASKVLSRWPNPRPFPALIAMMFFVGLISAFINNTAAVAVFIPIVIKLAKMVKKSRRSFLMPLSFAAIFGGTCTLVGTSTNILVNSIYTARGFSGFSMFEFSGIALILSVIGVLYMATFGRYLLRSEENLEPSTQKENYLTEVTLAANSPSVGKVLSESPLHADFPENIVMVKRDNKNILASDPVLQEGDGLILMCGIDKILALRERQGLTILRRNLPPDGLAEGMEVFEVVVPSASELIDHPLNHFGLTRRHGIIPLAIRHGQRTLFSLLRRQKIHAGDVLVVAARPELFEGFRAQENLLMLSHTKTTRVNWRNLGFTLSVLIALISLVAFGSISILGGALVATAVLLLTQVISLREAYESLDAQVLVLLGCMLSLGFALEKTGGAAAIANLLVSNSSGLGPYFVISLLYLATSLMTEIISNNATAALMTPIALDIASRMGLSEKPFLLAVMMAGSASFMTPVGYQTNTLVYAPGNYRFADYLKVGTPLNILFWLSATFLIPYFFNF